MTRPAVLLLLIGAAACGRRTEPPPPTPDAAPPVGEVRVPAPAVAAGDVTIERSTVVASGTVRLYRDGKWRGNSSLVLSLEVEARREVLAAEGGRATRLRLELPVYRHTLRVGGEERDLAPRLAGRSFIVDLAGGLSVVAGDGAAVAPEELAALRRSLEDADMWAPIQGRTLVLGRQVDGPPPWDGRFILKDHGAATATVAARLSRDLGAAGEERRLVVDGEATVDLATGRVTRFTGDGTLEMAAAPAERGRRGGDELVGDTRVRYVWEQSSAR